MHRGIGEVAKLDEQIAKLPGEKREAGLAMGDVLGVVGITRVRLGHVCEHIEQAHTCW